MTNTQNYTVVGMTCSHCVASVTEEVSEIPGVTNVVVDLDTSSLSFAGSAERAAVAAAVEEAGYTLA